MRRVRQAVAEAAISYLHTTYLDLANSARDKSVSRGRILRSETALGSYDAESARRQGCFLRLVSIVEAYVDVVAQSLFEENLPTEHDLVRRLVEDAGLRASSTWSERKDSFVKYHGIRLTKFARWTELDAGIEVRNSIAHGLGKLTPRQRGSNAQSKMAKIDVAVQDGSVIVSDASLARCRDVCIEFVCFVDENCVSDQL